MKDVETQQRFVLLRSQGWSFARIATELSVAKGTLINWSRKFQFEITNQRAIELEALQEQLVATREIRARACGEQLKRIFEGIDDPVWNAPDQTLPIALSVAGDRSHPVRIPPPVELRVQDKGEPPPLQSVAQENGGGQH